MEQSEKIARQLISKRYKTERCFKNVLHKRIVLLFRELVRLGYDEMVNPAKFHLRKCRTYRDMLDLVNKFLDWLYNLEIDLCTSMLDLVEETYGIPLSIKCEDYLNQRVADHTNKERLRIYGGRLFYEIESWIVVGGLLGLTADELIKHFDIDLKKPYTNALFVEAQEQEAEATRVNSGGVSYGRGRSNSAVTMLERLGIFAIIDSVRRGQWETFGKMKILGYIVRRGSSYPCSLCDSMTGFHPATYADLPPYHINCMCYAVPVTADER